MNRIQEAVNNNDWQKFRVSLKGMPTTDKLAELEDYYDMTKHSHNVENTAIDSDCDVCIRIDNYIKALCRGGQLVPGCDLGFFVCSGPFWNRHWSIIKS